MFQPLQTGRLGLTSQQKSVDTIGNNIANINTAGYKKYRMDFQDNLYTRMFNKTDMGAHMNLQRGTGVREYQSARIMEQGTLQSTGRMLDLALDGSGYFVLERPLLDSEEDAEVEAVDEFLYTRNGTFYLSVEEETNYLVDSSGRYVLDVEGERISIPDPDTLTCGEDGSLFMMSEEGEIVPLARLALVDFVNPGGLAAAGDSTYVRTVNSGEQLETVAATVRQGYLEVSNVDLAEEMTRMIRAQRAYQIAARCVTTADQMLQVANAIRS